MSYGIQIAKADGTVFFSTEFATWNFIDSFEVPSGFVPGTIREPASGEHYSYNNTAWYTQGGNPGHRLFIHWGGGWIAYDVPIAPNTTSYTLSGTTYFRGTLYNDSTGYGGNGEMAFGIFRTYPGTVFVPQSVTKSYPILSSMSEVIFQRSAIDNPPANQEGYVHSVSRSGNVVTASGGNVRTLVTVLGR